MTFGSDEPECYELVLQQARTRLSWRRASTRVLVIVGDAFPHEVGSARNKYGIDWKAEVELLRQLGVTAYCVQCRPSASVTSFMGHVAKVTGGLRLPLAEFRGVRDFLMAIAYREGGTDVLQDVYEREVRARDGAGLAGDVSAMLGLVRRASATAAAAGAASTKTAAPVSAGAGASRPKKAAAAKATVAGIMTERKSRKPKPKTKRSTVRVRRETCSGKNLPATLASLAWSTWRLVGQPGTHGLSRASWQPFGTGSVRRSLLGARSGSGGGGGGRLAVELAVQPRPGARRFPLFGRVLASGRTGGVTFGRLLTGRPSVRSQLLRVLSQGMRVHARVARVAAAPTAPAGLVKVASYAWNSGRSVRCSGVFVSVSERSLR